MQLVRAAIEKLDERRALLSALLNSLRPAIVVCLNEGILLMTENINKRQNKIFKIYDRIGFIGSGKETDFYAIMAGLATNADIEGMNFSPGDVSVDDLRRLAAQILSSSFHDLYSVPLKAQVILTEVSADSKKDIIFRIAFDGSVAESTDYLVIGGEPAEDKTAAQQENKNIRNRNREIREFLSQFYRRDLSVMQVAAALYPFLRTTDNGSRVEAILLSREHVQQHRFNKVYQELDLRRFGVEG